MSIIARAFRTREDADTIIDAIRLKSLTIVEYLAQADTSNPMLMKHLQHDAKTVVNLLADFQNSYRCWYCFKEQNLGHEQETGLIICQECAERT